VLGQRGLGVCAWRAWMAVVAALGLGSACSWIGVTPPSPPGEPYAPCTASPANPIIDTIVASLGAVFALGGGILLVPQECGSQRETCETLGGIRRGVGVIGLVAGAVIAIPYGISAHHGFTTTARCRERQSIGESMSIGERKQGFVPGFGRPGRGIPRAHR